MRLQPINDGWACVGAVVVADQVDFESVGNFPVDFGQELVRFSGIPGIIGNAGWERVSA